MPYNRPILTPDWMRVTEAAAHLGCDSRTVLAMVSRGELKVRVMPFGRIRRINRKDFDREMSKLNSLGVSA